MLPRGAHVTCYPGARLSHVTPGRPCHMLPRGALVSALLSFAFALLCLCFALPLLCIVSILSIVSIISMSPIRLCLRGPREPSEALGRPRGLLAFALLCLALLCLPLLCFARL